MPFSHVANTWLKHIPHISNMGGHGDVFGLLWGDPQTIHTGIRRRESVFRREPIISRDSG